MAVINGLNQRRVTLTSGQVDTIEFPGGQGLDVLSLAKVGTGNIAYKINEDLQETDPIDDVGAVLLTDDVFSATENPIEQITKISVVSDADIQLQWIPVAIPS